MVIYNRDDKELTIPVGWGAIEDVDYYSQEYLTIEALEDSEVYFEKDMSTTGADMISVQFSVDKGGWRWVTFSSYSTVIMLSKGSRMRLRGSAEKYGAISNPNEGGYHTGNYFRIRGSANVYGNIMSLCCGDNFKNVTEWNYPNVFPGLFMGSDIISAANLILPLNSVPEWGYADMFRTCSSLVETPYIVATQIGESGCRRMFFYCGNVSSVKCNFEYGSNITQNWLNGVAETGTFYGRDIENWDRGVSGIPEGWEIKNL